MVYSAPPSPAAYEHYVRARLAMEQQPPALDAALREIVMALYRDPRDPHLWTTRGEIELAAGKPDAASASLERALALSPGYPPAQRMLARVRGGEAAASVAGPDGG